VPAARDECNQLLPRLCQSARWLITLPLEKMNPDQFWTSQDGQILTVKNKDETDRHADPGFLGRGIRAEFEEMKAHLPRAEVHRAQLHGRASGSRC